MELQRVRKVWGGGRQLHMAEGRAQPQVLVLGAAGSFQLLTVWISDIIQTEVAKSKTTGANTGFQVLWEQRHLFK